MLNKKTAIAIAVLGSVYAGQTLAEMDGWVTSGSNARNASMQQNYLTMEDDFNVWMNPAYINEYTDKVYVDHDIMAGINKKFGFGNLGIYLGRAYSGDLDNYFGGPSKLPGGLTLPGTPTSAMSALAATTDNKLDVIYGMDMGGMSIGARINYNSNSETAENPLTGTLTADTTEVSKSEINIAAGLKMKSMPLDAGFTYSLINLDGTAKVADTTGPSSDNQTAKDDASTLSAFGRFGLKLSKRSSLLLGGSLLLEDDSRSFTSIQTPLALTADVITDKTTQLRAMATYISKIKNSTIRITTGGTYTKLNQKRVNLAPTDLEYNSTIISIPLIAAYESGSFGKNNNWIVRGAVAKNLYNSESTEEKNAVATTTTKTDSGTVGGANISIGAGYAATKALSIDASMDLGAFTSGTAILSSNSGTLISRMTISYAM